MMYCDLSFYLRKTGKHKTCKLSEKNKNSEVTKKLSDELTRCIINTNGVTSHTTTGISPIYASTKCPQYPHIHRASIVLNSNVIE